MSYVVSYGYSQIPLFTCCHIPLLLVHQEALVLFIMLYNNNTIAHNQHTNNNTSFYISTNLHLQISISISISTFASLHLHTYIYIYIYILTSTHLYIYILTSTSTSTSYTHTYNNTIYINNKQYTINNRYSAGSVMLLGVCTGRQMGRWVDGQIGRQVDRSRGRQIDRQLVDLGLSQVGLCSGLGFGLGAMAIALYCRCLISCGVVHQTALIFIYHIP